MIFKGNTRRDSPAQNPRKAMMCVSLLGLTSSVHQESQPILAVAEQTEPKEQNFFWSFFWPRGWAWLEDAGTLFFASLLCLLGSRKGKELGSKC